jgi:signal transduction histidine kinase
MQASALRMRNLIDALLTYSRVTTKAQPFVPVDLEATAREVVSDLEARIRHTGGRVDIASLPTIDADPLQMRQLLQNLIGNGLKFHKPGESPVVRVEGRMVENGQVGPHCEIAVSDNGIGFEEIYLDRIFELFQRLHGRQEYEGTGIGLAICRKIVERHGGSITATSKPDRGTTFKVTVPTNRSREVNST